MAFSRKQRNAIPVIAKQIAAINRIKPEYSGYFGTPEGIRTPDTRLRRAVLCPAELLARMQFLFVSVTPAVENPPNVRRRPLYPKQQRRIKIENIKLNDLSGSITLQFFEAMSQRVPIAAIYELYQVLEGLYELGAKNEVAIVLDILILWSDIQYPQLFEKVQRERSLTKDFAGEVLTDLGEILSEYL